MAIIQYPGTNFHDLNLDWVLEQVKNLLTEWGETREDWENLLADNTEFKSTLENEWDSFHDYILSHIDEEVPPEVVAEINRMASDGRLLAIITADPSGEGSALNNSVHDWMDDHFTPETEVLIDDSLTQEGAAADAKATGDAVAELRNAVSGLACPFIFEGFLATNGSFVENADYIATDFIPIGSKSSFALNDIHVGESSLAYAFYNNKKEFISGANDLNGYVYVDNIPLNAEYVRFSSANQSWRNLHQVATINNNDLFDKIVIPTKTDFFDGYNLFQILNVNVVDNLICDANGIRTSTNVWSMIFPVEPNTDYYLYIPEQNRQKSVLTTDYPTPSGSYIYFEPILYSKYDGTSIYRVTTNATAKYLMFYFYSGSYDLPGNKDDIIITKNGWNSAPFPTIKKEFIKRHYNSFSILGDSYSTFEGYLTPNNAGHWYPSTMDNNVTEIEQTWWYKFANQYGCTLKENVSWTGSTISYDGYGDGHADGKTISFITRMTNITNPDLILVYGGTNDSWVAEQTGRQDFLGDYKYSNFTESDFEYFRPSLAYVLTELKKKHIGSHIVFMLNSVLANIRESVQVICEHLGVPLCEMYSLSLTNAHPNQTGMEQIADYITAFLEAGN